MTGTKKTTLATVRRIVESHGGELVPDGCKGYEALAPEGCMWAEAEVWCYPIPLGECESKEERREMLDEAARMLEDGVRERS